MLTLTTTPPPLLSLEKIEVHGPDVNNTDHVVYLGAATLVFSTLILDNNTKTVILDKSNFQLHFGQSNQLNSHIFHFVSILHKNIGSNSLVVVDLDSELHFSLQANLQNKNLNCELAGVISLLQPQGKLKYEPHLLNDTFPHLSLLTEVINGKGEISTCPVSMVECQLSSSYSVPSPLNRGNFFFPSSSYQTPFGKPLFDLSSYTFPYPSENLVSLSQLKETPWDNELKNSDNHSLSPLGFCEGPLWGKPEIYFDEIISNMLVEHVTANDLKQFGNIYITFPFIFPANVGLHGMQIHPDRLLLPNIHKPIDIMRKYRSPSFTLIANIKIRSSPNNPSDICAITPMYLHLCINNKSILLGFENLISSDFEFTLDPNHYLNIKCRRTIRFRKPSIWQDDEIFLNYQVSTTDPLDINIDGTPLPCSNSVLQNRVLNVNLIRDIPTVYNLQQDLAKFLNLPDKMDVDEESTLTPEIIKNELQSTHINFNRTVESASSPNPISPIYDLPMPTTFDSGYLSNNTSPLELPDLAINLPDWSLDDALMPPLMNISEQTSNILNINTTEDINNVLNDISIDKGQSEEGNFEDLLTYVSTDKLEEDIASSGVEHLRKDIKETMAYENGFSEVQEFLMEDIERDLLNFNISRQKSRSRVLHTPPGDIGNIDTQPWHCYNAFTISLEKNLFLFENEKHLETDKKELQAPKLLAKIELQNESGTFESITALVDSGSDVTLITMSRLLSLVSQSYVNKHLTNDNIKLTSFSNTGIAIVGNIKLNLKLCREGPTKTWNFLIINQDSTIDMILGNDIMMEMCMSIEIKSKNNPEISLPNGRKVETYYERITSLNKVETEIILNPKQRKIIQVRPHAAFTAFQNERILVEGTAKSSHIIVPMASQLLPNGRVPVAIINRENYPVNAMIEFTFSRIAPDQVILEENDITDVNAVSLMVPVQISKNKEILEIQAAERTQEINVFKLNLKYEPTDPQSSFSMKNKRSKISDSVRNDFELVKGRGQMQSNQDEGDLEADKVYDPDKESEEGGISPENFLKDLDGKYLPPGYEVLQKSDIRDIIKLSEYPPSFRKYIQDIFIDNYSNIVSKNDYEIGALSNTLGPIKLFLKPGTKLPPFKKIYYLESTQAQALKDILSYLMRENIIEECGPNAQSGYNGFSSPAYLVAKSNPGKSAYRLIVNYKNLNSNLLVPPPILPSIDQHLQALRKGYLFSQFDLSSAFYSLRLDKESRKLTMFSTCFGSYRFKSLAMGLATAPGVFCNVANNLIHTLPKLDDKGDPIFSAPNLVILIPSPLSYCVIYFDDVCIFSVLKPTYEETIELHFKYVKEVMKRLAFHQARIKWSKTALCKTDIIFLGHRISNGKAYADPKRIEKLINAKFPTNLNLIRSFLGLINSLRSYLPATITRQVETLQELTKTKKGFNPQQRHRDAFEALKKMLTTEPLFTSIIDPAGQFYLFCDAASGAKASFSAVLTQVIKEKADEYPPFLCICDPVHNYIYKNELGYRPLPLYFGNERICKSKVERHIYDPLFLPAYYEKPDLGYKQADLKRTWFIALQSVMYESNNKLLDENEIRKEIVALCKKGLVFSKLKTFNFGGHHINTKSYLTDFQQGCANIDNYMFLLELAAETLKRTIIIIILDEDEKVETKVFNPNDKPEIVLAAYRQKNEYLFYPFKRVDLDTLRVVDFQNRIQIVSFFSRTVPQTTSVLDIAQVEAIGILWTLDHFKKYIKMCRLTLITDNLVFFSILSRKVLDCSTLMSRYALKILVQYPSTKIRFILTSHNLADFLTREHKIDKNTLLRLPLSAFTINSELSKLINEKKEYTLLEFKDFADRNQDFIITNKDVMGKQKISSEADNPNKDSEKRQICSMSSVGINLNTELFEPIPNQMLKIDNYEVYPNPYSSKSGSATPNLSVFAVTRSKIRKNPTPETAADTPKQITVRRSKRLNFGADKSIINVSPNQLKKINKHKQFLKENASKLMPMGTGKDNVTQDPQAKFFFDEPDPLPVGTDPPPDLVAVEPDAPEINDSSAPEPDYVTKIIDRWGTQAENELDLISSPKRVQDKNKTKSSFQSNPYKFQYSLAKLLFAKTRREILIKFQKEEYKDIYDKCKNSENFSITAPRGIYKLQEMLLFHIGNAGEERIVLPPSLQGYVIAIYHLITHHGGVKQLIFSLSHYYIPELVKLLRIYLSSCYSCLVNNSSKTAKVGHVPLFRPGYVLHVDLIEALNPNKRFNHILVVVDAFSKFVLAHPIKAKTTEQILPFLLNTVFQIFNVKVLVSDGGGLFVSKEFRRVMRELCIKHVPVSSNHPQANGQAEAFVKIIKNKLRKLITFDDNENWLNSLPLVVKCLNTTSLAEYKCSPLELMYGPGDANARHQLTQPDAEEDLPPTPHSLDKQKALSKLIKEYKSASNKKMVTRKARINKNLSLPNIQENSYIVVKDFSVIKGVNKTLHPKYKLEIFQVIKIKTRSVVARSMSTFQDKLISFSNLKVISTKNHTELNIPPVLSKLLLRDSKDLTFKEKLTIARKTGSSLLPEPDPDMLEDVSDDEDLGQDDFPKEKRNVTFDMGATEIFDIPSDKV